jgi:hypothetical protein
MNDPSPRDVVRKFFALLEQQRWSEVPFFVEPLWLGLSYDERVQQARSQPDRSPITAEQLMSGGNDMPLAVAQWNADRMNQSNATPQFDDIAGVETLEQLENLTPGELLARRLQAADFRYRLNAAVESSESPVAKLEIDPEFPRKTVIGDVISGSRAYVLFGDTFPGSREQHVHLLPLIRTTDGWKLDDLTPLLYDNFAVGISLTEQASERPRLPSVQQISWVDRTFDHQLSPEHFPAVLERFRGAPIRAGELMPALRAVRLARPNGKWSMQEHLGHLLDLEELGERRLRDFESKAPRLSAADMTNRKTDEADHNQAECWDLLERFRAARESLCRKLELLSPDVIAHRAEHPRLKRPMNVPEWVFFMCEHDDHHLLRLRELAITQTDHF